MRHLGHWLPLEKCGLWFSLVWQTRQKNGQNRDRKFATKQLWAFKSHALPTATDPKPPLTTNLRPGEPISGLKNICCRARFGAPEMPHFCIVYFSVPENWSIFGPYRYKYAHLIGHRAWPLRGHARLLRSTSAAAARPRSTLVRPCDKAL